MASVLASLAAPHLWRCQGRGLATDKLRSIHSRPALPWAQPADWEMTMTIAIIGSATWRAPVLVRIDHGASERVDGPSDAIHYLQNRWPAERGTYYSQAIADCKQAAEGMIPAEVAKESFISAAIEAHVPFLVDVDCCARRAVRSLYRDRSSDIS